jgi:hypothetical protein
MDRDDICRLWYEPGTRSYAPIGDYKTGCMGIFLIAGYTEEEAS